MDQRNVGSALANGCERGFKMQCNGQIDRKMVLVTWQGFEAFEAF